MRHLCKIAKDRASGNILTESDDQRRFFFLKSRRIQKVTEVHCFDLLIRNFDIDRGLTEAQWDSLIASGQAFSAECCKDIYNYVSKEFGENMREAKLR